MKLRTKPAKYGTCHAEGCDRAVHMRDEMRGDPEELIRARAFCFAHKRERDEELEARNARGGAADVLYLKDWECDPETGHVRRRG